MKTLSTGLSSHLQTGATSLARCWRIDRRDGVVMGFTDHDLDLAFDGVTFRAATGLSASRLEASLGLGIDDMSVTGILSDDSLSESDLARGIYDDALVTIYLVNWQHVDQRTILRSGHIGEVARSEHHFVAELRSLAHKLDQVEGRAYQFGCDATLGDARCGIDLDAEEYQGVGSVIDVLAESRRFTVSGLSGFGAGHFARGRLLWTDGQNIGQAHEVKRHEFALGAISIELWLPSVLAIEPGDEFVVTAGCDKHLRTCRDKFSNASRFRGFPHMPGNDFVVSYPGEGEVMDGGSRYGVG